MTLKISVMDGATPMLDRIAQIHYLSALAALDQAGFELREQTRAAFKNSQPSVWHVKVVNGQRQWYRGGPKSRFGDRFNFKKAGPESMANLINSFVMRDHLTLVVAGMNKRHTARLYYQEAKSNFEGGPQYASKPTEQVLGGSWAILQKLNDGGRFRDQSKWYRGTRMGSDTKPLLGEDTYFRPRKFVEAGRSAAMPRVRDIMTSKLESMIHKQVNRATVRLIERVS